MNFTRRAIIAGLLAGTALPALADAPKKSLRPVPRPNRGKQALAVKARHEQPGLQQLIRDAGLSGKKSIVVADVTTGEILESHGGQTNLPPASVTKTVTCLYALNTLGPAHRFATKLMGTGPIVNGVLKGDLVLAGGGDPHLDSDGLAGLVAQLKATGLRRISGKFRIYANALPYQRVIDPSQPDYVGYNPSISGINLNFNRVYFEWKRTTKGYAVTMDARGKRVRPLVRSIKMSIVDRKNPLFTYRRAANSENWTVARGALGKAGGRWLPVRNNEKYAGEVLRSLAGAAGITLPKASVQKNQPVGTVLAQGDSGQIPAVLRAMLKYSTNLTAEVTGLTATQRRSVKANTLAASAREMTGWARQNLGLGKASFADHSGLGEKSRLSGEEMVNLLLKTGWDGQLKPLLKNIKLVNAKGRKAPIAGVSVVAKTGTLNFASALAGYIECPNGRRLAFAMFCADLPRRAKISKAERERPQGGRGWSKRAKRMQQKLLRRWALEYGVG